MKSEMKKEKKRKERKRKGKEKKTKTTKEILTITEKSLTKSYRPHEVMRDRSSLSFLTTERLTCNDRSVRLGTIV